MELSKLKLDIFQKTLIAIGLAFLGLFGPTLFFLIIGDQVAATFTGTLTGGLLLAFTHALALTVGAHYSRHTMEKGADIALRAQETNDRWDERKSATMGKLIVEGARLGARNIGPADTPPLPLPSQGLDWLPPVAILDPDQEDLTRPP